jgi:tetratricopeptide (TPR) repeat protein
VIPLAAAQEVAEQKPPPESPLTIQQVTLLIEAGVSSADILKEAGVRGVGFEVPTDILRQLESAGATRHLLNHLSEHVFLSRPDGLEAPAELEAKGELDRMIESLNFYIERLPRFLTAREKRGLAYLATGRPKLASEDFLSLIRYAPDNPEYVLRLADAYERGGDARRAVFHATTVIEDRAFNFPLAHLVRGRAHLSLHRHREARDDLQVALQHAPLDIDVLLELSRVLLLAPDESLRDPDSAAQLLRMVSLSAKQTPLNKSRSTLESVCEAALAAARKDFDAAVLTLERLPEDVIAPNHAEQLASYREKSPWYLRSEQVREVFIPNIASHLAGRLQRIEGGTLMTNQGEQLSVKPFLIARYEVTNREWTLVTGDLLVGEPDAPRQYVSLVDARRFLTQLNKLVGQPVFRLPTEAEWEFASRAGATSKFYFGEATDDLSQHAWHEANAGGGVHVVGQLAANPLGLYDVYGNVAEWCAVPSVAAADSAAPPQIDNPQFGILRGGSLFNSSQFCNSFVKITMPGRDRRAGVGIRLAADSVPSLSQLIDLSSLPKSGLDGAIADLERRIGASTTIARDRDRLALLYYVRGCNRFLDGRHAESIVDFGSVLQKASAESGDQQSWNTIVFLARCQRAWILATSEVPSLKNVTQARDDAETALTVCNHDHWAPHAILAAVHAAQGDFDRAVQREQQATPLAEREGKPWSGPKVASASRERLESYRARELPKKPDLLVPFP